MRNVWGRCSSVLGSAGFAALFRALSGFISWMSYHCYEAVVVVVVVVVIVVVVAAVVVVDVRVWIRLGEVSLDVVFAGGDLVRTQISTSE